MKIQKKINIELMDKPFIVPIDLVQYNTGVQLVFTFLDFEIPTGTSATLYVQKKSGNFVYQEKGITVSGNVITIDLENQAITEYGYADYQIELKNGTDAVSTFAGLFRVAKSLADANAVESTTVIRAFETVTAEKIAEIQASALEQINEIKNLTLEKIDLIEQTTETNKQEIEDKGIEVLATIPDDYTELSKKADEAIRTKADAIVQTVQGETVAVSDSSDDPLRGLKVFGRSTQETTKGVQLFDENSIDENLYTVIGSDGIITIDCDNTEGTANKYATFYNEVSDLLEVSTTYAVVCEVFSTSGLGENIYLTSHYSEELSQFDDTASITTPTVGTHIKLAKTLASFDSSKYMCRGFMTIPAGVHVKASLRISVLADTTITADTFVYEKFTGGKPGPNPDYPLDIETLGSGGAINVNVHGGNLIPYPYVDGVSKEMNGVTFTVRDDGSILVNGTATATAYFTFNRTNNKIRLPKGWLSTSGGNGFGTGIPHIQNDIYVDGVYATSVQTVLEGSSKRKFDGVVEIGGSRVKVDSGVTVNNVVIYPILCNFENVLDFELSKGVQTLALTTPDGLPGVPVTSGGNYTDASGQEWICDEIDLERGKYIQRVKKIVVDGSDSFYITKNHTGETRYLYNVNSLGINTQFDGRGYCDKLTYNTSAKMNEDGANTKDHSGFSMSNSYSVLYINIGYLMTENTVEEFKSILAENPLTFLCVLKEPVETDLTAEEIQAYKAMVSHCTNTTVFNDAGAFMEVSYNADLKSYIGNPKSTGVLLTDTVTGKIYELKIVDGKVIVEGVS